ncbi:MAG: hypothetical protein IPK16_12985 [Anaerolineales bacterium]|nr:hypothetical protein [Anaerolineales bacterium]
MSEAAPNHTGQTPPAEHVAAPPAQSQSGSGIQLNDVGRTLWLTLVSPWPLLALSILLALLIAAAVTLPQLPSQFADEAGAAGRWLTSTANNYGVVGAIFRALGFYTLLRGPLLQILLAALAFILLVQFANECRAAIRLRRVSAVLDHTGAGNGEPVTIAAPGTLLRWRQAFAQSPLTFAADLRRLFEARWQRVERRTLRVDGARSAAGGHTADNRSAEEPVLEERMLAIRGLATSWLRPLLLAGMLLAAAMIWLNTVVGWAFTAAPLLPGERAADAVHDLQLEYGIDEPTAGILEPVLRGAVNGDTFALPVYGPLRTQIAGTDLVANAQTPALYVRTLDGAKLLEQPGQSNTVAEIGLGFPNPDSEELLLIRSAGVALRILRQGDIEAGAPDTFLVEIFRGESEGATDRFNVSKSSVISIPGTDGPAIALIPLPSLSVEVRHAPALWLVWPALVLVLAGALGYWRRPGFLLAQVGPWPVDRAVLVVQSDLPDELAAVQRWYTEREESTH